MHPLRTPWLLAGILVALASSRAASGDAYLVGAQFYRAMPDGANNLSIDNIGGRYEFSTNTSTGHYPFPFLPGGGTGVLVRLDPGENQFTFSTEGLDAVAVGLHAGLNVMLSDQPVSFNPPAREDGTPGTLTVFTLVGAPATVSIPQAGVLVQSYSGPPYSAAANGMTEWVSGSWHATVSSLVVEALPGPGNYLVGSFTLTVGTTCRADWNGSGSITVQDIFAFLADYFGGYFIADFNGSGNLSVQDIFEFLAAYFTGCP